MCLISLYFTLRCHSLYVSVSASSSDVSCWKRNGNVTCWSFSLKELDNLQLDFVALLSPLLILGYFCILWDVSTNRTLGFIPKNLPLVSSSSCAWDWQNTKWSGSLDAQWLTTDETKCHFTLTTKLKLLFLSQLCDKKLLCLHLSIWVKCLLYN